MNEHKFSVVEPKSWYESRTLWVNAIILIITVAVYVLEGITAGEIDIPLDPEVVVVFVTVANAVLRLLTRQPLRK